jgi:hypothetical protein
MQRVERGATGTVRRGVQGEGCISMRRTMMTLLLLLLLLLMMMMMVVAAVTAGTTMLGPELH